MRQGTGGGFDSSASFPLWTTTTNAYAAHMVEKLRASGRESGNHPGATSGSADLQGQPVPQRCHDVPGAFPSWLGDHGDFGGSAEEETERETTETVAYDDGLIEAVTGNPASWVAFPFEQQAG